MTNFARLELGFGKISDLSERWSEWVSAHEETLHLSVKRYRLSTWKSATGGVKFPPRHFPKIHLVHCPYFELLVANLFRIGAQEPSGTSATSERIPISNLRLFSSRVRMPSGRIVPLCMHSTCAPHSPGNDENVWLWKPNPLGEFCKSAFGRRCEAGENIKKIHRQGKANRVRWKMITVWSFRLGEVSRKWQTFFERVRIGCGRLRQETVDLWRNQLPRKG